MHAKIYHFWLLAKHIYIISGYLIFSHGKIIQIIT